jgi:glycosyltransferase involved in cell wall biosynthesis
MSPQPQPSICHLTSVHPHQDTRIFHKECRTLAEAGYRVYFIAPGAPEEIIHGVHVHGVRKLSGNRLKRMTKTVLEVYQKALSIDADIYHFHDPELIPIGLLLRLKGKQVIYDIHEDVPRQIFMKQYIPSILRESISWSIKHFEHQIGRAFSALVPANPYTGQRLHLANNRVIVVNNYPIIGELLTSTPPSWQQRSPSVAYVGAITEKRGIVEMIRAMEYVPKDINARFELAGDFYDKDLQSKVSRMDGWHYTCAYGRVNRLQIREILNKAQIGLVILHPENAYIDAQRPTKLFEYMSAGIPVIASDFPYLRNIVEQEQCGLVVDPLDPHAIARAITFLLTQPRLAEEMGKRGLAAVKQSYNWGNEASKLLRLYQELMNEKG